CALRAAPFARPSARASPSRARETGDRYTFRPGCRGRPGTPRYRCADAPEPGGNRRPAASGRECPGCAGYSPPAISSGPARSSRALRCRGSRLVALFDDDEARQPDAHLGVALAQLAFDPGAEAVEQAPFAAIGNAHQIRPLGLVFGSR